MSGFIALFNTDGAPADRELLERLTTSLAFKGLMRKKPGLMDRLVLGMRCFRLHLNQNMKTNLRASMAKSGLRVAFALMAAKN